MTRACSTGRAAAVTMPTMLRELGSGRESEYAVLVVPRMAHANTIVENRRIAPLLPLARVYGHAAGEVKRGCKCPARRGAANGERRAGGFPRYTVLGSHTASPSHLPHHDI